MTTSQLEPVTPAGYFNVISPSLSIPSNPRAAIPVGLLACQRDPLLKELETIVVSSTLSQPPPVGAQGPKKTKNSVIAPDLPSDPLLEVVLHDTIIFPEGGGQPTDTGIITTISNGNEWEVVQAKRHGGHAVHYVRVLNNNIDAAILAFSPGERVTVSLGEHGWNRRHDHMSMHTSQHLLSAILETRLGLPTLSWSLTGYPSPCYVEIPRGLSRDEIQSIQDESNALVFKGRRIWIEVQELDEDQEKVDERPRLENGRAIGKGLPDDYTGGVKRTVVIDGVDRNPCCGTHCPSIQNLLLFLLPHTEPLSRSSTTSARLYFLCGPRLIMHLTSTHVCLTETASTLSCNSLSVPERVNQVIEERRRAEKRVADLEFELAKNIADGLAREMKQANVSMHKKHVHRVDDTTNPLGFLNSVSTALAEAAAETAVSYVFILSSSPSSQTSSSTNVILILGSDDKLAKDAGDLLKSRLGVKGGGKGPRWSGKFSGVWKQGREGGVIENVLQGL